MLGEGGEGRYGTNINYLLEQFGMAVNSDSVVRTVYYKYLHPKVRSSGRLAGPSWPGVATPFPLGARCITLTHCVLVPCRRCSFPTAS